MSRAKKLPLIGGRTSLERDLLAYLYAHENETVTHEQLYKAIWPDGHDIDMRNTLRVHVSRLRSSANFHGTIQTVYGQGYRYIARKLIRTEA